MKTKLVEAGKLVELPEMEKPDLTGAIDKNDKRKAACQTLSCPTDWGTVGEVYEENVHYRKQHQTLISGLWIDVPPYDYIIDTWQFRIIAVPIVQAESGREKPKCCECGGELSLSDEELKFAIEMEWEKTIICNKCWSVKQSLKGENKNSKE